MFFSEPFFKKMTRARLVIDGELIICGQNFIHIPGITRVWVGWVTKPVNWEALFLLALAFTAIFALKFTGIRTISPINQLSALIGVGQAMLLLFLIVSAASGYIFYIFWMTGQGLHVELASGHTYVFFTRNRDFLQQAYRSLGELIKAGPQRAGLIDFNELTVKNTTSPPEKAAARPAARPRQEAEGRPQAEGQLLKEVSQLLRAFREHHPQNVNTIKQLEESLNWLKAGDQHGFQRASANMPPYLAKFAEQLGLPLTAALIAKNSQS